MRKGRSSWSGSPWGDPWPEPSEAAREIARRKCYYWQAGITAYLYWHFWPAGLIVNFLFVMSARADERVAGHPLPGVDCLRFMWNLAFVIACLFILSAVAYTVAWLIVRPAWRV